MTTDDILQRGRARRQLRSEPSFARLVRQRAGLTQAELAELLGVDRSAVSRYESGARVPTGARLEQYSAILDRLGRD